MPREGVKVEERVDKRGDKRVSVQGARVFAALGKTFVLKRNKDELDEIGAESLGEREEEFKKRSG